MSLGGNSYFVHFIDEFTRKMWIYLIKKKSEVFPVFKKFKVMAVKQSVYATKTLRIDGGGEYTSNEFQKLCDEEGMVDVVTTPYTP